MNYSYTFQTMKQTARRYIWASILTLTFALHAVAQDRYGMMSDMSYNQGRHELTFRPIVQDFGLVNFDVEIMDNWGLPNTEGHCMGYFSLSDIGGRLNARSTRGAVRVEGRNVILTIPSAWEGHRLRFKFVLPLGKFELCSVTTDLVSNPHYTLPGIKTFAYSHHDEQSDMAVFSVTSFAPTAAEQPYSILDRATVQLYVNGGTLPIPSSYYSTETLTPTAAGEAQMRVNFAADKYMRDNLKGETQCTVEARLTSTASNGQFFYTPNSAPCTYKPQPRAEGLTATYNANSTMVALRWTGSYLTNAHEGYWGIYLDGTLVETRGVYDEPHGDATTATFSTEYADPDHGTHTFGVVYMRESEPLGSAQTRRSNTEARIEVKPLSRITNQNMSSVRQGDDEYIHLTWATNRTRLGTPLYYRVIIDDREVHHLTFSVGDELEWYHVPEGATPPEGAQYAYGNVGECSRHSYRLESILQEGDTEPMDVYSWYNKDAGQSLRLTACEATKGSYRDRVRITATAFIPHYYTESNPQFTVYRRLAEAEADAPWRQICVQESGTKLLYYDDEVTPGQYYEYRVECTSKCQDNERVTETAYTVGFTQMQGTLSGNIVYGTGVAVEGVEVRLQPTSEVNDEGVQWRARAFVEPTDRVEWTYPSWRYLTSLFGAEGVTLQMWTELSDTKSRQRICSFTPKSYIGVEDGTLFWHDGVSDHRFDAAHMQLPSQEYALLSMVCRQGQLTAYITTTNAEGDSLTTVMQELSGFVAPQADVEDTLMTLGGFRGYVDDLRLWHRALNGEEIARLADRYIVGNEDGLETWWNFDEPLVSHCFDYARNSNTYNGHHARVMGAASVPRTSPALQLKATTDSNGCYTVRGVPFSGNGTTYSVVPSMGLHEFKPARQERVVSATALVPQASDFKDVSSFPLHLRIVYDGTTIPVDSVYVEVDGTDLVRDGRPLMSDANGYVVADVPIGLHRVSVKRGEHVFVNEGIWPEEGIYDYQSAVGTPTRPIEIRDLTKVCVMGRVVGGDVQGNKSWGESSANIGQAEVVLSLVDPHLELNTGEEELSVAHTELVACDATVQPHSHQIVIQTNDGTGEFSVMLPPVRLAVERVQTGDYISDLTTGRTDFGPLNQYALNLLSTQHVTDTIGNRTFELYGSLRLVRHNPVEVEVWDEERGRGTGLYGDDRFSYQGRDYSLIDGDGHYVFGYPIFSTGLTYDYTIRAYERYKRPGALDIDAEELPCAGMRLNIINGLGSMSLNEDSTALESPAGVSILLDDKGEAAVRWLAGYPRLGDNDHTLAMTILREDEGQTIWEQRGIVTGSIPVPGSDFVTVPREVAYEVIHDPYGTNSYAYREKSRANVQVHSSQSLTGSHVDLAEHAHLQFGAFIPKVADAPSIFIRNDAYIFGGMGEDFNYSMRNYKAESTTLSVSNKERITTSSGSLSVGPEADLFVGMGINSVYSDANGLWFMPSNKGIVPETTADFALTQDKSVSVGTTFGTHFVYTRKHIRETLIPNLHRQISDLLSHYEASSAEEAAKFQSNDEVRYVSLVPKDSPLFGQRDQYVYLCPDDGKMHEDLVSAYIDGIENWTASLRADEETQYLAAQYANSQGDKRTNVSISAGTSLEHAYTMKKTSSTGTSHTYTLNVTVGAKGGFLINKGGFNTSVSDIVKATDDSDSDNDSETTSEVYGYVLKETVPGNFLAQDIVEPHTKLGKGEDDREVTPSSYVFILQGGQTEEPYERCLTTQYYKPGTEVGVSTQSLCAPYIRIKEGDGVATTKTFNNLRAGQPVTLTLQLGSESPQTLKPKNYNLLVPVTETALGLNVRVGGNDLREQPMNYVLTTGQPTEVSVTIIPTSSEIYDYEGLRIRLSGTNSDFYTIYDEVTVNLHYVPAATNVEMTTVNRVVSTLTDQRLNMVVTGYDRHQWGFGCIDLLYREKGAAAFHNTLARYWLNEATAQALGSRIPMQGDPHDAQTGYIGEQNTLYHAFDMQQLPDGDYEVVAIARSLFDRGEGVNLHTEMPTFETPVLSITKDTTRPTVLGAPMPVGGTLDANGQIGLNFSEDIDPASIKPQNISVSSLIASEFGGQKELDYTYSASNRTLIIKPQGQRTHINNDKLRIRVEGVCDKVGNTMAEPVEWDVKVNWLPVNWGDMGMKASAEIGVPTVHTNYIVNSSVRPQSWRILPESLPSWLTVWPMEGNAGPMAKEPIYMQANEMMPVGTHYANVVVAIDADTQGSAYEQYLSYQYRVVPVRPDWTCQTDTAELSMTVMLRMETESSDQYVESEDDVMAAFVGDKIVGIGHYIMEHRDGHLCMPLTIHATPQMLGEPVRFTLWSVNQADIFGGLIPSEEITVAADAVYGSMEEPVVLRLTDASTRYVDLVKGWNWVSLGLNTDQATGSEVFRHLSYSLNGVNIKTNVGSRTEAMVSNRGSWTGSALPSMALSPTLMYAIYTPRATRFYVEGRQLNMDETPIVLTGNGKWTWLPYLYSQPSPMEYALENYQPTEGDVIKSMSQFAIYSGGQWQGPLNVLLPTYGYKYCSRAATNTQLRYSNNDYCDLLPAPEPMLQQDVQARQQSARRRLQRMATRQLEDYHWQPVGGYADNMTVLARVYDGLEPVSGGQLAGFVGEECRGCAFVEEDGLSFIAVQNDQQGSEVAFTYWDGQQGPVSEHERRAATTVNYAVDAMLGSIDEPLCIQLDPAYVGLTIITPEGAGRIRGHYDLQGRPIDPAALPSGAVYLQQIEMPSGTLTTRKQLKP